MNKGLEVIEARWLFGFAEDKISIVVHPQSVVHSMVELVDGSVIAQLGVADMKHAIQYALTYPERRPNCLPPLDITRMRDLTFEEPDTARFPCLELAYRAIRSGGTMPAAMNAANEIAVSAFLDSRIRFTEIPEIIDDVMSAHETRPADSVENITAADNDSRVAARAAVERRAVKKAPAQVV
jgi:1-deoxy-D-xylulose-5-phosphate reductoisomerase